MQFNKKDHFSGPNQQNRHKNKNAKHKQKKKKRLAGKYTDNFPSLGQTINAPQNNKSQQKIYKNNQESNDAGGEKNKKKRKVKKNLNNKNYTIGRLKLKLINISKEINKSINSSKKKPSNSSKSAMQKDGITIMNKKGMYMDKQGKKFKFVVSENGVERKEVLNKPSKIRKSNKQYQEQVIETLILNSDENETYNEPIESEIPKKIPISKILPENLLTVMRERENFFNDPNYSNKGSIPKEIQVRGYVDHLIDDELDKLSLSFINRLSFNQQFKKKTKPLKYRKRVVSGFNEVKKSLQLK